MEFDWINPAFDLKTFPNPKEIEESFEDPFALRLMPDSARFSTQARYINLGRTLSGKGLFSVYRSDGKIYRVIASRAMTEEENYFYERRLSEWM
jgi:uncharacterized DUF497 family protein